MNFLKTQIKIYSLILFLLLAVQGIAQDPGGNPDGPPPAVPFDDYMYPILIIAGVVLVFFSYKRLHRKAV